MSCTTVLVGKNASNDRSTMIARTDDGHFDVKKLIVVEPKDQPKKYKSVLFRKHRFVIPPARTLIRKTVSGRLPASTLPMSA